MCHHGHMQLRVVRRTDRFDEASRFWGELMGCSVTREWPADEVQGRGRIFGVHDGVGVELIEVPTAEPVEGVFLALEVDDVDALHRHLADHGITILQPPTDQPWGHRNIAVLDPSGIRVGCFHWLTEH